MRTHVQVLAAALALLLAGWVAWRILFGGAGAPQLVVAEVQGEVVLSPAGGPDRTAAAGDAVGARDQVRVGGEGGAVLTMGEGTRLQLEPDAAIRVLEADASGVRVELEGGRVQARVRAGSPVLGVSSQGRAVVARNGAFRMGVDPDGALAVEAEAGALELEGFAARTALDAGQRLVALPGEAPVVDAATEELLLSVRWPEGPVRETRARIEGATAPYTEVVVRPAHGPGLRVRAGADGRFRTELPVDEGDNTFSVVARDPTGRRQEAEGAVTRDSEAPTATRVEVGWGP